MGKKGFKSHYLIVFMRLIDNSRSPTESKHCQQLFFIDDEIILHWKTLALNFKKFYHFSQSSRFELMTFWTETEQKVFFYFPFISNLIPKRRNPMGPCSFLMQTRFKFYMILYTVSLITHSNRLECSWNFFEKKNFFCSSSSFQ